MGESAGAYCVASLLALPEAEPLFHKAIAQSGFTDPWEMRTPRRESSDLYMKFLDAESLADPRAKTPKEIQDAETRMYQAALDHGLPDSMAFYVMDGLSEADLLRAGRRGKPLLHGTTMHEYHAFLLLLEGSNNHRDLAVSVFGAAGFRSDELDELIPILETVTPERERRDLYIDAATAAFMHYPHARASENYGLGSPTYVYLLDWASPTLPTHGAFHGLDLPLVFGNRGNWAWALGDAFPTTLAENMQDAWIAFARSADPNHPGLPAWPVYNKERRATMRFDEESVVDQDPLPWVRELGKRLDAIHEGR